MSKVCVRFAPSPTGFFHIGGLRTALFNWLWARKNKGGKFILRIDDTDRTRYKKDAVKNIQEALDWYELNYDIGPIYQSSRLNLYKEKADWLVKQKKAYYCFHSAEEIERDRKIQPESRLFRRFSCEGCKNLKDSEINEKKKSDKFVVRIKIDESGHTSIKDTVYGSVGIQHKYIHDVVLLKSDGYPTYHLASVVDDISMEITNVIRGEEWLTSTPLHKILYKYFGKENKMPTFTHLPMVLGPDKSKLSKRHGAVAALEYKEQGYLPEAILNFIALLGWNPKTDQEIFTIEELKKEFDLEKINKSSAIFNIEKLDWLNGQYIKKNREQSIKVRTSYLMNQGYGIDDPRISAGTATLEIDRLKTLNDPSEVAEYTLKDLGDYNSGMLIPKGESIDTTIKVLKKVYDFIGSVMDEHSFEKSEFLRDDIVRWIKEQKLTNKQVLWPLRVAITGEEKSADVFEVMEVIGKLRTIERVRKGLEKLQKG